MSPTATGDFLLPLPDWIAIAILLAGLLAGAVSGLARSFALLLWMVAALWLGHHLSDRVVQWLPNSVDPEDPVALAGARLAAFGAIAALVLLVPLATRLLGGAAGKKKAGESAQHKPFGALVGLAVAVLFVTLTLPWLLRIEPLRESWGRAATPELAASVAGHLTYLYPPAHRQALLAH